DLPNSKWSFRDNSRLCLTLPAGDDPLRFVLWTRTSHDSDVDASADELANVTIDDPRPDLSRLTQGGPPRWPEKLTTRVLRGDDEGPFAVDVLTAPASNPWLARVRLTGFDFYDDGDRMAICSWDGDVWQVSGLSQLDASDSQPVDLTWQRIASGLFQPLGLRIVDGQVYISCRDQITILHDLNDDGETDFYQCFNRDHQVTDHFHEFAMGLQTDAEGNFYYAKSARHALTAVVPHHGTLLRVSKDGKTTEILAKGFRAANGVCLNPDGSFIVTDQEGHWNPKNRINWVQPGGFYGNMFGYHDVTDASDDAMEQPLCWITNAFDRSPAELLWVESDKWGPLDGQLLNLSYGYGKVYVVPHEEMDGQKQGGMCALPIPQFPTGTMRGRFRPTDGQLYLCGMFAWAGSQQQDGGLYRLRYTGHPVHLPIGLNATKDGMQLTFSGELDRESATNPDNYSVKVWSLKRTKNYGSKHYDEHPLKISAATLAPDDRTVTLLLPEIAPTWGMEIKYKIQSIDGTTIDAAIHNTIHHLGESPE
ncbi:MAG: heme-binding protein, partial [Pirellulaceae bacterium]|nr:heme-binding protein [Pirellulaceae bacterium]